jgi:LCP family protein required for cell wall assembly
LEYASNAVLDRSSHDDPPRGRRGSSPPPRGRGGKGGKTARPKDPLWAKLCVIFGALLMLGSGVTIVGGKVLFNAATKSFTQTDLFAPDDNAPKHASIDGAKNILLVGIDTRPGQNPTELVRADSVMIMHIPASHDRAYLVSIPRDTYIDIPAYNNGATSYRGGKDKINAAFAYGGQGQTGLEARKHGFRLLELTLKNAFHVDFHAGAIVDFAGFQEVVGALGGVDMYVDEKTISVHVGHTKDGKFKSPYTFDANTRVHPVAGVIPQVYNVGFQHLAPWQALDFVRQRELLPDGDYGRARHQQQFVKAVFKGILSRNVLTDPGKLAQVLDVVGKAMTVDNGRIALEDWIFAMRNIGGSDVVTIKTNGGSFFSQQVGGLGAVEALNETSLQLMESVRNDSVDNFINAHPDWVSQS